MDFDSFEVKRVSENDVNEILLIIDFVFPYTCFDKKTILKKLQSDNFFLIKVVKKNLFVGFAEIEFFKKDSLARLNAIFVSDEFRRKGIGKLLLGNCFKELEKQKIKKIFLLVKESNIIAKDFYKNNSFCFEKLHDKILDDSIIEVWSKII